MNRSWGVTCSLRLTLATRSTLAAPQEAAIARAQSAQLRLLEATQRECEDILACSQMSGDGEGRDQGEEADSRRQGEPLLPQHGQLKLRPLCMQLQHICSRLGPVQAGAVCLQSMHSLKNGLCNKPRH